MTLRNGKKLCNLLFSGRGHKVLGHNCGTPVMPTAAEQMVVVIPRDFRLQLLYPDPKLILRTTDGSTSKFLAEGIGTQDYYEPTFSVSQNSNGETSTRAFTRRNEYLFLPSEIKDLPTFHGIFVMPSYPTSRVVISRDAHSLPDVALPIPRIRPTEAPLTSTGKPTLQIVKPTPVQPTHPETDSDDTAFNF